MGVWAGVALFGGAFVLFFGHHLRSATAFLAVLLGARLATSLMGWHASDARLLAATFAAAGLAAYLATTRRGRGAVEIMGIAAGGVGALSVAALMWGHLGPDDRALALVMCLVGMLAGGCFAIILRASGEALMTALLGATAIISGMGLLQSLASVPALGFLGILLCLGAGVQSHQLVSEEAELAPQQHQISERLPYAANPLPRSGEWASHYDHSGAVAGH